MRILLLLFAAFIANAAGWSSPAWAQLSVVPAMDNYATKAQVATAQTTAQNAAQAASEAAAAMPQPSSVVGAAEMVGGSAGSTMTYKRGDWVPPRISRAVQGTTGSNGTAVVSWAEMPTASPRLMVTEYVQSSATQVPKCFPVSGTLSATGVTVKCYLTQSILGLGLLPYTVAPAGVVFDVIALPNS